MECKYIGNFCLTVPNSSSTFRRETNRTENTILNYYYTIVKRHGRRFYRLTVVMNLQDATVRPSP